MLYYIKREWSRFFSADYLCCVTRHRACYPFLAKEHPDMNDAMGKLNGRGRRAVQLILFLLCDELSCRARRVFRWHSCDKQRIRPKQGKVVISVASLTANHEVACPRL